MNTTARPREGVARRLRKAKVAFESHGLAYRVDVSGGHHPGDLQDVAANAARPHG